MWSIRFRQHFLNCPLVICEICGLRGCLTVRAMLAGKVEKGRKDCDRVAQIFEFLGISKSLAGKSAVK